MFTEQVLERLSYRCGCPLDVRKSIGIVNGHCPTHPENKLLFDNMDLKLYQALLKEKKKKLDAKSS